MGRHGDGSGLVSALRKGGKAHSKTKKLLRDVYSGRYEVFVSVDIFEEYQEVLSRLHAINAMDKKIDRDTGGV